MRDFDPPLTPALSPLGRGRVAAPTPPYLLPSRLPRIAVRGLREEPGEGGPRRSDARARDRRIDREAHQPPRGLQERGAFRRHILPGGAAGKGKGRRNLRRPHFSTVANLLQNASRVKKKRAAQDKLLYKLLKYRSFFPLPILPQNSPPDTRIRPMHDSGPPLTPALSPAGRGRVVAPTPPYLLPSRKPRIAVRGLREGPGEGGSRKRGASLPAPPLLDYRKYGVDRVPGQGRNFFMGNFFCPRPDLRAFLALSGWPR